MIWFWAALLATAIWSITNHIDKYLITRYYAVTKPNGHFVRPWTPVVTMAGAGGVLATLVALVSPGVAAAPLSAALLLLAAGALYVFAVIPYFRVLAEEEASKVVPIYQLIPVFVGVLGFVFLRESLSWLQLAAGALILLGAVAVEVDIDAGFALKKKALGLLLLSMSLYATEAFLFKFVALDISFWSAVFYQYLGAALTGLALWLCDRRLRDDFRFVLRQNPCGVLGWSGLNDTIYLIGRLIFNYATLLAPLALVTLVNSFQPFIVILYGILIAVLLPKIGHENISPRHLGQKLGAVALILLGAFLLFAAG